jgi:hypothetical protein
MAWKASMGPKEWKEVFFGKCGPNKRVKITAFYEGIQMTKDDIIPPYILRRIECEWIKAGNHCPHIGPCPFVEQERYY